MTREEAKAVVDALDEYLDARDSRRAINSRNPESQHAYEADQQASARALLVEVLTYGR